MRESTKGLLEQAFAAFDEANIEAARSILLQIPDAERQFEEVCWRTRMFMKLTEDLWCEKHHPEE